MILTQSWLNLRKFLTLALISKDGCQITTLSTVHLKKICSGSWFGTHFGDLSYSQKLFEIEPPLERTWNSSLPLRCCPPMVWWCIDWTLCMLLGLPMLFCFWRLLDDPKMSNLVHLFFSHPCEGLLQPM